MSDHPSDEELARRARDSADQQAFAGLVRRHQGRVRLWIAKVVRDREDAYDLAQEVFLAAWQALPRFRSGAGFGPWLRGIARHRIADHLRRRYRRQRREGEAVDLILADLSVDDPPAERRLDEELIALRRCLDELDERRRRVIEWRYLGNLSMAQIEERLGRNAGYAANLLLRLRRRLAACLEQRLPEAGS